MAANPPPQAGDSRAPVACPLCGVEYPAYVIETHAADCGEPPGSSDLDSDFSGSSPKSAAASTSTSASASAPASTIASPSPSYTYSYVDSDSVEAAAQPSLRERAAAAAEARAANRKRKRTADAAGTVVTIDLDASTDDGGEEQGQEQEGGASEPRKRAKVLQETREPGTFTVLSWNVWFEPLAMVQRMRAISKLIWKLNPELVALQEVTHESYALLAGASWAANYYVTDPPPDASYFTVLASKYEPVQVQRIPFANSYMGRDVLLAMIEVPSGPGELAPALRLAFATSHLESGSSAKETRKHQLAAVLKLLSPPKCPADAAVFVGDLNLRKAEGRPLPSASGYAWQDVWTDCLGRSHMAGRTMDSELNPLAANSFISPFRTRYDRVLVRASGTPRSLPRPSLLVQDLIVVGNTPVDVGTSGLDILFPSDHFGLLATLSVALPSGSSGS